MFNRFRDEQFSERALLFLFIFNWISTIVGCFLRTTSLDAYASMLGWSAAVCLQVNIVMFERLK